MKLFLSICVLFIFVCELECASDEKSYIPLSDAVAQAIDNGELVIRRCNFADRVDIFYTKCLSAPSFSRWTFLENWMDDGAMVEAAEDVDSSDDRKIAAFIDVLEDRLQSGVVLITMQRGRFTPDYYKGYVEMLESLAEVPITIRSFTSITGLEKAYMLSSMQMDDYFSRISQSPLDMLNLQEYEAGDHANFASSCLLQNMKQSLMIYKYQSNSEIAQSIANTDGQLVAGIISSLEQANGKMVMLLEQLQDEANLVEDFIRDIESHRSLSNVHIVRAGSELLESFTGIRRRSSPITFIKATMVYSTSTRTIDMQDFSVDIHRDFKAYWNFYRKHANLLIIVYETNSEYAKILNRFDGDDNVFNLLARLERKLDWHVMLLQMGKFYRNEVINLAAGWTYFTKKVVLHANQCITLQLGIVLSKKSLV